jgi:hypothetical protein
MGIALISTNGAEMEMDVLELIVFFGDPLTNANIEDIETYLSNKYGL